MPSIKLKSISGKGVKSLVIFQKPTLYAVVFLSSGDKKNKKKTPVDRTNGENPEWDQPMRVDIDSRDQDLILQFDLKAEAILGDRLVGKARIRVADLDFSGSIQHASYQLRTQDGKPNGVLNFSYWIEAPGLGAAPAAAVQAPVSSPTPVVNYSPPPSSPAPVVNYSPLPSAPAAGLYPDVSYPPSAPPVPVSASGYYPAADPGYYPPQDSAISYPPQQSGPGYYPSQDSTISYPPPPVSAAAADYYPPPPAARYYPPPGTHISAYPPPQESQQISECCDRSLPQPASGWGYPPPPSAAGYYTPPGTHIATYPPPPESQRIPECCDRSLPQPASGRGYPPPPSAAGYYPPPSGRGYPPPPSAAGYYPPPGTHIATYPPPPESQQIPGPFRSGHPGGVILRHRQLLGTIRRRPPGTHIAAYPPPQESQQMPESSDRSLPQPTPVWGYLSQARGVYGFQQDCWDRGLYGYT